MYKVETVLVNETLKTWGYRKGGGSAKKGFWKCEKYGLFSAEEVWSNLLETVELRMWLETANNNWNKKSNATN